MSNEQGFVSQSDYEAYEAWVAQSNTARAEARARTLEEHDAHLRQYGTGDADYMAKRAYMLEHGLEYRDVEGTRRVLKWAPSTVYSAAAYEAKLRAGRTSHDDQALRNQADLAAYAQHRIRQNSKIGEAMGGILTQDAAKTPRDPFALFSRETIVAVFRAQKTQPMSMDAREALTHLQHTFEEME